MTFHIFVNFLIVLFSYGKVKDKDVFLIRIKFHLGRAKGRGRRGYGGESLNEVYFYKILIIKQDTNFISPTFGQTNFLTSTIAISMPKTLYAEIFKWFSAVLPGQKQLCLFLKNKYGFQIVCFKKLLNQLICLNLKKTRDILLKTKDGLLKTEDELFKTEDAPSVNRKSLTHILTYVPTHPHTQTSDLDDYSNLSLWLSLITLMQIATKLWTDTKNCFPCNTVLGHSPYI